MKCAKCNSEQLVVFGNTGGYICKACGHSRENRKSVTEDKVRKPEDKPKKGQSTTWLRRKA